MTVKMTEEWNSETWVHDRTVELRMVYDGEDDRTVELRNIVYDNVGDTTMKLKA